MQNALKIRYLPQISIFDNEKNRRVTLEHKSYIKYLGVLIDENLSWKNHLDCVITKISKTIGMIAKLRHFVPSSVLTNIYKSLILPYLTNGLVAGSKEYLVICKKMKNKSVKCKSVKEL